MLLGRAGPPRARARWSYAAKSCALAAGEPDALPKSAAERQRESRARNKCGKKFLALELDLGETADKLVEAGFLEGWSAEDPKAIAAALAAALDRIEVWPVTRDARKKP